MNNLFSILLKAVANQNAKFIGSEFASGKNRAFRAANQALSNTLPNNVILSDIRRTTLKIIGSKDMSFYDVEEASSVVYSNSHSDVDMNFMAIIDDRLRDKIQVRVIGD